MEPLRHDMATRATTSTLLMLAACGRVQFDPRSDGAAGSDVASADVGVDGPLAGGQPDIWYRFDEGSGTVLGDSGLGGHDAALTGTFTWTAGAIHFTQGLATTAPLPGTFRIYPLTVAAWMVPDARTDQTSNAYSLTPFPANAVSNDTGGVGGFGMGANVWTDGTPGSSLRVGWVAPTVAATFTAGQLVHVALAYTTAGNVSIYVNGVLLTSRGTAVADGMMAALYIGAHNLDVGYGTKRFYAGTIDDVRIYRRLLTANEVAGMFTAGPL